jgi:glycine/D-amino acid oxidase-like deaminating enzyme
MHVAVIGGGAFGAMTAIKLAECGQTVTLFERLPSLMQGATFNANRLHLGFHYPRDEETALQCMRGFEIFKREFSPAILPKVTNAYFIASEGSLTSPRSFLAFCRRLGLRHQEIEPDAMHPRVSNVDLGLMTDEVMFDGATLRRLMNGRLAGLEIEVRLGQEVTGLQRNKRGFDVVTQHGHRSSFDAAVNCCYANINRLTAQLDHPIEVRQYEYAAVPIIELDWLELRSITILDGPFMSLLPFGEKGRYLLYHVRDSVIAEDNGLLLDPAWLDPSASPFASIDQEAWFNTLREACCNFIPALRDCRLKGFVQGPRMVLAHQENNDARRSVVTSHEPRYVSVFAGKIDHCTWVAEEVAGKLGCSP